MKFRWLVALLVTALAPALSLDREAFTFTRYDLQVTIDRAKGTLSANGSVELRNESKAPQRNVALQVTSSLQWTSVAMGTEPLPLVSQPYTSDIDHTGALSEAIATLPQEVQAGGTITLRVAYEGPITRDASRLTRIGTPQQIALRSDWDEISERMTAVRGIGYVTWFPVALTSVNLSEGESTFDAIANWKARHRATRFELSLTTQQAAQPAPQLAIRFNSRSVAECKTAPGMICERASYTGFTDVPSFSVASYETLDRPNVVISYLPDHSSYARDFAAAIERMEPALADWLGKQRERLQVIELADAESAPFDSGDFLFAPLQRSDPRTLDITVAHSLAHSHLQSPRPWISEGVAHLMQVLVLERQAGRRAAISAISRYYPQLIEAEAKLAKPPAPGAEAPRGEPLVSTSDPFFFRSKALSVWFMVRDMLGDEAVNTALQAYRPEQDTQPAYLQSLLERPHSPGAPPRSMEWFFDDWVYRDRGLPDFHIESAYARKTLNGTYVVTITVSNAGGAGAEVPVTVAATAGERTERVIVSAGGKSVVRVSIPASPVRVTVNDGSVPEMDSTNNTFTMPASSD